MWSTILQAKIEPRERRVKSAAISRLRFTLEHVDPMQVNVGQFGRRFPNLAVWDGKYSNGYRNYGFEVRQPDGTTVFLQPKEILDWDKNVPHLVSIPANGSYVLPNWVEGRLPSRSWRWGSHHARRRLHHHRDLTESGDLATEGSAEPRLTWGGRIATNTIKVEVAP